MRVEASLNNLRMAPRKVRLVTHLIVGLPVEMALTQLGKKVKRAALPLETLLKSAIANATNNFHLEKTSLVIKEVQVGDGKRLKRFMPKAFGQATPILRRSSKVRIVLEGNEEKKTLIVPKKEAVKKETKKSDSSRRSLTKAEAKKS